MFLRILVPLLIVCGVFTAPVRAEEPPAAAAPAQEGMLLLRNGQVLRGKITPAGDYYFVTLPMGEIRLRTDQVELQAPDLEACYQHKRAAIDPSKVKERQDLAQWCILQEMYDNAAHELAEAATLDGKNPRTALIERQLALAREQPARRQPSLVSRPHVPSNEDLDRLIRGMPPGSVETFSSTIQPLLLNTCSTSGCHGSHTQGEFKLVRVQMGKGANRRLTQRNLHSVLQMIDREDPPGSRLLTAPIGPHGETGAPIFTSKQAVQYRQLVHWVSRVAQVSESDQPASVERPDDKLLQRVPMRQWSDLPAPVGKNPPGNPPADAGVRETTGPRPIDPAAQPAATQPPAAAAPRGGKKAPAATVDPFDPEAFNRRFLPP